MARGSRRHGPDLLRGAGRIPPAQQEAGILHHALQLREHITGHEILAHARDGIGLEAMILRRDRMSGKHRGGGDG
jgi:hypothetical protein